MLKYSGRILQFGFGAVGKSFFEKLSYEVKFDENNYIVVTKDYTEFAPYINLGGISTNFYTIDVNRDNFKEVFGYFLSSGDILIDFADTVGTRDICKWCADNNIMYLNTGEADWPDNWYSIFNENLLKREIQKHYKDNSLYNNCPIVLQHGNNPGLVSHFVKAGIEYIVSKQFKKDKNLKKLLKEKKFNEIAKIIGIRMIHVNDIDLQCIKEEFKEKKLVNTWCIDSFFFELLSEATQNIGTHELVEDKDLYRMLDIEHGFLEYKSIACDTKCRTYYPNGVFDGYLVPHEETITIANSLEVIEGNNVIYRPSVMFIYKPCHLAIDYLEKSKVNNYPNVVSSLPQDCDNVNGISIVRGHIYPEDFEIVYKEKIDKGTEYVGVLLMGDNFDPVWVGNRIEMDFLYKKSKDSYWQSPTITPVAMSALAAFCWMIKNKDKRGIYFPEDIDDYKYILGIAEKYISKTIYETYSKDFIEETLGFKLNSVQSKEFFAK